jgi:hypothetical protein
VPATIFAANLLKYSVLKLALKWNNKFNISDVLSIDTNT